MPKLMLKMSMTIDGFVGGPNGEIDWIFKTRSEDAAAWTVDRIGRAGAHLMGRKTFNDMAAYWPNSSEVFAAPMNEIPKIVFSRKGFDASQKGESSAALKDAVRSNRAHGGGTVSAPPPSAKSWREARVITGDLALGIRELKQQAGKDLIAHGGASFAQSLVQTDLIETKSFSSGTVANIYRSVS